MAVERIGVMIASPSDTKAERNSIAEAIQQWNARYAADHGVILECVRWETHATPGVDGRPQGMINAELLPKSECLLAVFRVRIGSPTGTEISGTIEEIREFLKLGKCVAVYFFSGKASITKIDPTQLAKVNEFKEEMQVAGLVGDYKSSQGLKSAVLLHLAEIVRRVLAKRLSSALGPTNGSPFVEAQPVVPILGETSFRVDDSEDWVLLGSHFLRVHAVDDSSARQTTVTVFPSDSEEEAFLVGLRPKQYQTPEPIGFAFRSDAYLVRCTNVATAFVDGRPRSDVTLEHVERTYGGGVFEMGFQTESHFYPADELAALRARRILFAEGLDRDARDGSEAAQLRAGMLEHLVQGLNTPMRIRGSPLQSLGKIPCARTDPKRFLQWARLLTILFLKTGDVVERVERLELKMVLDDRIHVRFRGTRHKKYTNIEPTTIALEGDCPLSPTLEDNEGKRTAT